MNKEKLFEEVESSARSYCRSFPTVFTQSKGSLIYDNKGNKFVDFLSGAGALNYGHNNDVIKNSVMSYLEKDGIAMSLDLHSQSKLEFIEAFSSCILKPRNLEYKIQFTSPTGTSVVESAVKLARKYTKRENVVCFTNAFHGMTGVSLSLTGSNSHRQGQSYSNVTRFPFEGYAGSEFNSIDYYRKLLTDPSSGIDLPAAIILETVQAEGGLNVASVEWLQDLRLLTSELGILLIIDDIQTGCGRSGSFFSFERAGIKPDLVCLSKSIGGMGLPMALLLIDSALDVWRPAEDNGTFRGNNLAFVASTAMVKHFWSDEKFELEVADKALYINQYLNQIVAKYPALCIKTKGIGLMQGIEMRDEAYSEFLVKDCFANGVIVERCGPHDEVFKLMPALTIDYTTLNQGFAVIDAAFAKLSNQTVNTSQTADAGEGRYV
ncbi:diaminobutyrate-2-oxoglutarate transaminase [Pseudoalteromonas ulvae UL12]|uniref:diaminobutyrate--2-oxoglutarate transaminase n=1 Tax=Pseudoalteromonas ulvae TaxID=107327 RepID=UPI00186BA184|nr:diaminobutyrate--2-oxoglutarate transaminase [Pseudoalteromonas ulvae]MBE0361875.1 diaminobutyrate-2-oxoglutarate transaminase [Pseudoalteromonas ulvae UL12]